jgi:hypothetical protein
MTLTGRVLAGIEALLDTRVAKDALAEDAARIHGARVVLAATVADAKATYAKQAPKMTRAIETATEAANEAMRTLEARKQALGLAMKDRSDAAYRRDHAVLLAEAELRKTADPLFDQTIEWVKEQEQARRGIRRLNEELTENVKGWTKTIGFKSNTPHIVAYMHALLEARQTLDAWKCEPWTTEEVAAHCAGLVESLEAMRERCSETVTTKAA